jgi:hypothetical protein
MDQQSLYLAHLIGFQGGEKGPPTLKVVTGTNPAANAEISDTVPTGKLWRLLSWAVTLAQGATQTPTPNLVITDGTNEVVGFPLTSAAVSAATTTRLTAVPGVTLTAGAGATRNYAPIPSGLLIPAGWKLTTVTTGIGANTDYGSAAIFVAEYAV